MIAGYLFGTLLFGITAQQIHNESRNPTIIRVDKHNAVNADNVCNYYIEIINADISKLFADLTNGMRIPLCTGTTEQCEACLDRIVSVISPDQKHHQIVNHSKTPNRTFFTGYGLLIPFLNKNVALRSETHRAISFSAFCAFRGKSRGRDAPPTTTLQILMSDLLSELVLVLR